MVSALVWTIQEISLKLVLKSLAWILQEDSIEIFEHEKVRFVIIPYIPKFIDGFECSVMSIIQIEIEKLASIFLILRNTQRVDRIFYISLPIRQ